MCKVLSTNDQEQVDKACSLLHQVLLDDLVGVYLYGSATLSGLKPNSDLDLLVLIRRSLSDAQRWEITHSLLNISGAIGDKTKRCLEITMVVQNVVEHGVFPLRCEYMYGEWLRDDIETGHLPQAYAEPDLSILLWQAQQSYIKLLGTELSSILDEVPFATVKRAITGALPQLLNGLKGDEANVLLTLCRMWYTLVSTKLTSKDKAATWAMEQPLADDAIQTLELARCAYVSECNINWCELYDRCKDTACLLKSKILNLLDGE